MAIATGDAYIASAKQIVPFTKTASTTTIATTRFSVFDKAGNPGAGTLALTTALTGSVEASGTAGYPSLTTFGGGATGYLSRVAFASSVVGRIELWDRLFGINAGDSGVNSIQTVVVGGTAGAGAVNIIVLRPLWTGRINIANGADLHGPDKTGMPVVFATSALYLTTIADSTSSGVPDLNIEIANG